MKIFACYERVSARRAVVELTDEHRNFQGAFRVDVKRARDLYEVAYQQAAQAAACKGAQLERFREHVACNCAQADQIQCDEHGPRE